MKRLEELNIRNILKHTSKREIMEAFFGTNKIYGAFSSPLRDDEHPSFSVSRKNCNYTDHTTKETGDIFDLIKKFHSVNLIESLAIAVNLVGISHLFETINSNKIKTTIKPEIKGFIEGGNFENLEVKIKSREFEDYDIEYWESYGISIKTLKICGVIPISHYFLNELMIIADKYAYAYKESKDGKVSYKIYQPVIALRSRKFVNNNKPDVWELFTILPPKGKYLIITSSRKDAKIGRAHV